MWNCTFEELVSTDVDIAALVCCSCTWDARATVSHGRQAQPGTDVKLEKLLFWWKTPCKWWQNAQKWHSCTIKSTLWTYRGLFLPSSRSEIWPIGGNYVNKFLHSNDIAPSAVKNKKNDRQNATPTYNCCQLSGFPRNEDKHTPWT